MTAGRSAALRDGAPTKPEYEEKPENKG
jgi:hypothetical protein